MTQENALTAGNSGTVQSTRPLRFLVVDDDALGRSLMDVMLSPHGYKLDFACDGKEALEAIQNQSYDLVFMDLILPDMNGREVCRRVREWEAGKRHVSIVAVTAYDLPGQPLELVKAGLDDYIFKPYDLRGLTRIINLYAGADASAESAPDGSQPVVRMPDAPVLDIEGSLLDFSNDVAAYQDLLRDFIESLPVRLGRMRQAHTAGDNETLRREAHSLKGISAGLGATPLSRLADQVVQACSEGRRASVTGSLGKLEQGMAQLRTEAEAFLASAPGQPGLALT